MSNFIHSYVQNYVESVKISFKGALRHMLHLIFGRAGSGKTEYAHRLIEEQVRAGGEAIAMVPEQGSFDCERALLRRLGPRDARRAEVLSFTRLSDRVGREYGGFAGRRLNDTGRTLFMSLALEQVSDRLTVYRRPAENSDFLALLLGASAACKMGAASPEALMQAAAGLTEGVLRSKTEELGLILAAYDALVAEQFLDPQDDLTRLAQQLQTHPFFRGRTVVLDAFKGFTAQEFAVLDCILAQAQDCWITLCTDQLDDPEHGAGLFSNVRRTAQRLIDSARRHDVPVAAPVTLEPGARFASPMLRAAEAALFRSEKSVYAGAPDGSVVLAAAANKYEEADWIAAEIHRMAREEHRPWRDFTIIVRREADYAGVLDRALRRAGIPCFMDVPADVTAAPLMADALAALEAANTGMDSDAVFRCLKTGLFGLTTDEIAALENYTFLWSIDRDAWLSEWAGHPRGFADEWTDDDRAVLAQLNALRARVAEPFGALRRRMDAGGTGAELAVALYNFLTDTGAAEHLTNAAAALTQDGDPDAADAELRLWNLLMDILDQTALVLRQPLSGRKYARLLELAIASAKLGELPQSLNEVTVGGADRTRPAAPKVVFLAGAVQGVFPAATDSGGLFTDRERRLLAERGLDIARSSEEQTVEERFLAYTAVGSPSERLVVSYWGATTAGEGTLPSELVSALTHTFPALTAQTCDRSSALPETEAEAFDRLAAHWGESTAEQAALQAWFTRDPQRADAMAAVARAAQREPFRFADSAAAQRLFGTRMRLSPSRVELFYQCPFRYFCRYGMNAQERRPAKIDALEYGTLIHDLLEQTLRARTAAELNAMSDRVLAEWVQQLLEDYLERRLGGRADKSERFLTLYARFAQIAAQLLRYIAAELAQSRFAPAAFELEIAPGSVKPVHIALPDGGSIEIVGKIDRVDYLELDGVPYVRVIDYKTGAKKFSLNDILCGVNMQMLLYLMTLHESGFAGKKPEPAGVLYLPARSPRISASHDLPPEAVADAAAAEMRMSGMVLQDDRVIRGMEPGVRGVYIPVKLKKDGTPDAHSSLYTLEQFGIISRHMKRLVAQMGAQLHRGEIDAAPLDKICARCGYAAVCGHEADDPVRALPRCSGKDAMARMTAEDAQESS